MEQPPTDKGFQRTLIAVHRAPTDETLRAYAALLARNGMIRDLRLLHVLPEPDASKSTPGFGSVMAEMKSATARHFTDLPTGVQLRYEVRQGPLIDGLLEYAAEQQVDLVMVGNRKDHPLRRSLARRLAMKAPCSVWLVPEGSPVSLSHILVPIDFSARAADALSVACVLAAQAKVGEIAALHVYFDEARTTYDHADDVVRGREADTFKRFLAPINTFGVRVLPLFESGSHPAHTIARLAVEKSADLIVLNTRGRSASAAVLLGSVAEETLIESSVPVLVIKHFGARLGVLQALLDRTFRRGSGVQFD